jgi:2-polyprenyl-3-methyl-5-hydroxy-6-metoxy-1,4-benzoquinol methylase
MLSRFPALKKLLRRVGLGSRYELPSRQTWEQEYRQGAWDYLRSDEEMPRYAVIATYLRQHCPGGLVLDAGCGEGILCDHLWPGSYSHYCGIDFSSEAIARANARPRAHASFDVADVTTYVADAARRFDAIVFNEVLYCTEEPGAVVRRFREYLKPQGILITSTYSPWLRKMQPANEQLDAAAEWSEEYAVNHHGTGRSWVIRIWGGARLRSDATSGG